MIISGSTLLGIVIANSFSKRVKELFDIKTFLTVFETSMSDIGMHTEDILQSTRQYMKTGIKQIISKIYSDMQTEYPDLLEKSWEEQIIKNRGKLSLTDQDIDTFISIGKFLGNTGLENQKKHIQHMIGVIDKQMEHAVTQRDKNKKIALNFGVLGGLMITLMLM